MSKLPVSRARFLALGAAAQAAMAAPLPALAQASTPAPDTYPLKLRKSLVLSGGGALGAYAAGVVQTLADRTGVKEGQPLPDYGLVCGTSIGALNAYLVATAQWSKLRDIWMTISNENVIRLKPEFAKITDPSSGVFNRIWQAIALALGSGRDVEGVIDGENLRKFMISYLDLNAKVVTPMIWAVTNLTTQLPEYYYLLPDDFGESKKGFALNALQISAGPSVALRQSNRADLIDELRASAAVPLAFDPIWLTDAKGNRSQYVDGGVTQNTPISAARALSSEVDAVLLSPPLTEQKYDNLFAIGLGSFGTMQRVLMIDAIRIAFLEGLLLEQVMRLPPAEIQKFGRERGFHPGEIEAYGHLLSGTSFAILQPKEALPARLFGFDNAQAIAETYQAGQKDAAGGFLPFNDAAVSIEAKRARQA